MASAVKTWAHNLKGQTLGGRYLLGDVIGVGGMGAVFQGEHLKVGRQVAIKLLVPDLAEDEETGQRFHQEAQAAARIARRGVVEVFDFDDDEEYGPYLVMELLRGESLSKRIKRRGRLEVVEALSIGVQMVDALAEVHAQKIVHRDLKPANVFLAITEEGDEVVKLLDFGISRIKSSTRATQLTKPGVLLGTPRYMSPEQAWCKPDVDHRTDLYAVGAIMYHALSGSKPYQDLPQGKLLEAVLKRPPKPLREVAPDLPEEVFAMIDRAMQRERDQRFQSADEMRSRMMHTLEEMARSTSRNAEMSDETPYYPGLTLGDLGETMAMDPTNPPEEPDPSSPQSPVLGKTTVGYSTQRPSGAGAGGPPAVAPPPATPPKGRQKVPTGNTRGVGDRAGSKAFESGPHPALAINSSPAEPEQPSSPLAATKVLAPSDQTPSGPTTPEGQPSGSGSFQPSGSGSFQPSGSGAFQPSGSGSFQPGNSGSFQPSGSGSFQPGSSGSFDQQVSIPPKKRAWGKVLVAVVGALILLGGAGAGGLWVYSSMTDNGAGDGTASEGEGAQASVDPGANRGGSPPRGSSASPAASSLQRWREELQLARAERDRGQPGQAQQRLSTVVTEVERSNPSPGSEAAGLGTEACLLLGDLAVRNINSGQAQAGSAQYLTNLASQLAAANQHYQRALNLGAAALEQCVYLSQARAFEWAAEAALRASRTPGLDPGEVTRRQAAWRSYLDQARGSYQRAQAVSTAHPTCGPQAAEGFARIQERLSSPPAPPAP